jgi:hypothetical protein
MLEEMKGLTLIIGSLAAAMWLLGYLYWVMLSTFSLGVTSRIKE